MDYKRQKYATHKVICDTCGRVFFVEPYRIKEGVKYCSLKCSGNNKKEKVKLYCKICGDIFEIFPYRQKENARYCSAKCARIDRVGLRISPNTEFKVGQNCGNKNHFWKGGITLLNHQIRGCFKYRQWRSDIFERDDFTCQICGIRGVYLEAHHIKKFYKIIEEYGIKTLEEALSCEELWNINNGVTLCRKCHNMTKGKEK